MLPYLQGKPVSQRQKLELLLVLTVRPQLLATPVSQRQKLELFIVFTAAHVRYSCVTKTEVRAVCCVLPHLLGTPVSQRYMLELCIVYLSGTQKQKSCITEDHRGRSLSCLFSIPPYLLNRTASQRWRSVVYSVYWCPEQGCLMQQQILYIKL